MRTIRESLRFGRQCQELGVEVKRLDEVLAGAAYWAAATNPEELPQVPGTDLRCVITDSFPGAPSLRLFFRIADEDYVDAVWIEVVSGDLDDPLP